ncbi:hypothetical protein A2U01_0093611, partial [Trifolium medium]|nr:hypothetical protein [Trifolium medium]
NDKKTVDLNRSGRIRDQGSASVQQQKPSVNKDLSNNNDGPMAT